MSSKKLNKQNTRHIFNEITQIKYQKYKRVFTDGSVKASDKSSTMAPYSDNLNLNNAGRLPDGKSLCLTNCSSIYILSRITSYKCLKRFHIFIKNH